MLKHFLLVIGLFAIAAVVASGAAAQTTSGRYIVVLKDGVHEASTAADHALKGAVVFDHYRHALNGYAATLSPSALAAVRADSRVLFVAPDGELQSAPPPPPAFAQVLPDNIDRIDGDLSSTRSGNGSGSVRVNVAVIDTGIDPHPDLDVAGGVDCTNDPGSSFTDPFGHGTHVAGTIGALDNDRGVVGVAPGSDLWALRVFNRRGIARDSFVICAIDFATSTRSDANRKNDIAVANMSLGDEGADDGNCGRSNRDPIHRAICRSVKAGVSYVVAAGNDGVDFASHIPAAYDEVLTVTAMTDYDGRPGGLGSNDCDFPEEDDTEAFFSNYATLAADQAHTIAAPGVCVVSTASDEVCGFVDCYGISDGTSHSAPAVAGTAALCITTGKCSGTPAQIMQKVRSDAAAYNLATPGYGFQGDPLRPISGRYYGFLIRAGSY
jgi:subtilisin